MTSLRGNSDKYCFFFFFGGGLKYYLFLFEMSLCYFRGWMKDTYKAPTHFGELLANDAEVASCRKEDIHVGTLVDHCSNATMAGTILQGFLII